MKKGPSSTIWALPVWLALTGIIAAFSPAGAHAQAADDFYIPPVPLPAGKRGDIIRSRPVAAPLFPEARVTQIMYQSSDEQRRPVAVTGAVLVPATLLEGLLGSGSPRRVVVMAPGTRGLGDTCAPSKNLNLATTNPLAPEYEASTLHELLQRGYVVAVTDYVGGGTPIGDTYLVGRSEGFTVLDALRAAQRLSGTGASADSLVGILGYSQGGQAAAWAGQLQPSYAPELRLKGIAAGGVPTDVLRIFDQLASGTQPDTGFLLAGLIGHDNAYPELNLTGYLTAAGVETMVRVRQACTGELFAGFPFTSSAAVTNPDVMTVPVWRNRIADQMAGTMPVKVPVHLYHGTLDEIVPFENGVLLRQSWCSLGVSVEFQTYPVDHGGGMYVGPPVAIQFLADRFAGVPPPNNCP